MHASASACVRLCAQGAAAQATLVDNTPTKQTVSHCPCVQCKHARISRQFSCAHRAVRANSVHTHTTATTRQRTAVRADHNRGADLRWTPAMTFCIVARPKWLRKAPRHAHAAPVFIERNVNAKFACRFRKRYRININSTRSRQLFNHSTLCTLARLADRPVFHPAFTQRRLRKHCSGKAAFPRCLAT